MLLVIIHIGEMKKFEVVLYIFGVLLRTNTNNGNQNDTNNQLCLFRGVGRNLQEPVL